MRRWVPPVELRPIQPALPGVVSIGSALVGPWEPPPLIGPAAFDAERSKIFNALCAAGY